MGLVEKANILNEFLNERFLEKEFTKEKFDFNGVEYDGKSISTDSYFQPVSSNDYSGDVLDIEIIFEEYQIAGFKSALRDLKNSFVEDYFTAYIPLVEKIAIGNSLRQHLIGKLETFRNNKIGQRYASLLSEFIEELSNQYIDVVDRNENSRNSFKYSDKFFHRGTIPKLYHSLIANGLLGSETSERDFIKIFQNHVVDTPIRWIGQTSELKYFIELINRKDLGFEDRGSYKWRIAVKCFLKISSSTLKTITYKDLRTYKITENTKLKLDNILVDKILSSTPLR